MGHRPASRWFFCRPRQAISGILQAKTSAFTTMQGSRGHAWSSDARGNGTKLGHCAAKYQREIDRYEKDKDQISDKARNLKRAVRWYPGGKIASTPAK